MLVDKPEFRESLRRMVAQNARMMNLGSKAFRKELLGDDE